jgi:hypothetical protein
MGLPQHLPHSGNQDSPAERVHSPLMRSSSLQDQVNGNFTLNSHQMVSHNWCSADALFAVKGHVTNRFILTDTS